MPLKALKELLFLVIMKLNENSGELLKDQLASTFCLLQL